MVFVMTNTRAFGLWLRLALKEELSLAIFFFPPSWMPVKVTRFPSRPSHMIQCLGSHLSGDSFLVNAEIIVTHTGL